MPKKVLLIDDDSVTNFISKKMIENTGLADEILIAQNGKLGLDILLENNTSSQRQPDLILLDLNMPVMSGFDFLAAFRHLEFEDRDKIRIAILSSSDNIEDKSKARKFGVQHYLVKPVDMAALISVLT